MTCILITLYMHLKIAFSWTHSTVEHDSQYQDDVKVFDVLLCFTGADAETNSSTEVWFPKNK